MALQSAKGPNIPKNHIRLTKRDAVLFQLDIMSNLAPPENSFFIKYGPAMVSVFGISSSIFINGYYRKSVNIGNLNRIYTALPLTIAPAFAHLGLHQKFVRDNIIVQKWACPYCYQIRSSFFQVFFGVLLPVATSAVTAFANARRVKVEGVPALNNRPEIFKFFLEKTRPFSRILTLITVGQLIIGAAVAQAEAMENNYFNKNIERFIAEYERKAKNPHKNHVN